VKPKVLRYKKVAHRTVNKYHNIKHHRRGGVAFPGRSELEEHLAALPLTSDAAGDFLRGPGRWLMPPPLLPRYRKKTKFLRPPPNKLSTKHRSSGSNIVEEACSG
jgi:hypothetical protein